MTQRVRDVVGVGSRPCGLCGSSDVVLVRSRTVGNLFERVLGRVDPDERTTATCRSCGSRVIQPGRRAGDALRPVAGSAPTPTATRAPGPR